VNLDAHVALLTREDGPESQTDRQASVAAIKLAAHDGVDLTPYLSSLEALFLRSWDDRLLTDLAEIMVRHAWSHDPDGTQLAAFMALPPNGAHYAFAAMRSWAKQGLDLSRFLPWLLERADDKFALRDLLGDMVAAAPSTMESLLERLGTRTRLGCDFLSHFALWMRKPAASALPWLAGQLGTCDSVHHLKVLRTIRLVMEQDGVDGTAVTEALESFLDHEDPEHQWFAAYSRTRHALRLNDGSDLDRLADLPGEQARMGSLAGLVVSLGKAPAPAVLDRALRFFLDPCPAIRLGVTTGLSHRAPEEIWNPTEEGIRGILPALGDTVLREEVVHYLHGLIRTDSRWREEIGPWIDELSLAETDGARELLEGDVAELTCEVCRLIPRCLDAGERRSWPEGVSTLRPAVPKGDADGHLTRCRSCGDWYLFSQTTFTDVNMEDVSGTLRRLTGVEAIEMRERVTEVSTDQESGEAEAVKKIQVQ